MSYERIMGINVTDDNNYQNYRNAMTPLLHAVGGDFGFDFKVSEVLRSKSEDNINRVFTIEFPSEKVMNDFFSSEEYLKVKNLYFDISVKSTTVISMHQK